MKILGRHYAESFLKLAFPDTAFQLVGTLENVEITLPDRRADFLHRLQVEGEEYLLHFEFQLLNTGPIILAMFLLFLVG